MTTPYTLATYHVRPGMEDAFMRAWADLATTFASLPNPPFWGTLLRSTTERTLFHSFGPWEDASHVAAMRNNAAAKAAFESIKNLCAEMTAGDYEVISHVRVREEGAS